MGECEQKKREIHLYFRCNTIFRYEGYYNRTCRKLDIHLYFWCRLCTFILSLKEI